MASPEPADRLAGTEAAAGAYPLRSRSVAQRKGHTVRVQFRATTDGWLATDVRVDDVSLQ